MSELIEINTYPVKSVLSRLLLDKTTGKNIIFATDYYIGYGCADTDELTVGTLLGFDSVDIQPRVRKAQADQSERTRKKAEVFTPTWIVKKMNDHCDSIFREEKSGDDWQKYVSLKILEITCGEAPFLVTRYEATTGEVLPIAERTGILDRKLQAVSRHAADEEEWLKWAVRAFESSYGYEFQGDNLLIARINLLVSFCDYLEIRWHRKATDKELEKISNIIAWNIWQMDGLKDTVPLGKVGESIFQLSLFEETPPDDKDDDCRVNNWRSKNSLLFRSIKEGMGNMKFDFVIGNPPYQDEVQNKGDRPNPIYDRFMDASFSIGTSVCLIHPARFLFNAGQTSKQWNNKMLQDTHFKVLYYQPDASKIFSNTDIKGGIAITYRDSRYDYGAIEVFTSYDELNSIVKKISHTVGNDKRLDSVIASQGLYRFSDLFFTENPNAVSLIGTGTGNKIVSNIIEKLPEVFLEKPINDNKYIRFLGRVQNQRAYRYIRRDYLIENQYIDAYNVFLPEANNSGHFGETLTEPVIGYPGDGAADTFLSAGMFNSESETTNFVRYFKTKFFRALLGVKKVTQHCPPHVWQMIPLQNFTEKSDIDWSNPIPEIDKQLYIKYNFTQEEIDFIESHVKEME